MFGLYVDHWKNIFQFLTLQDLGNCRGVCKSWRSAIEQLPEDASKARLAELKLIPTNQMKENVWSILEKINSIARCVIFMDTSKTAAVDNIIYCKTLNFKVYSKVEEIIEKYLTYLKEITVHKCNDYDEEKFTASSNSDFIRWIPWSNKDLKISTLGSTLSTYAAESKNIVHNIFVVSNFICDESESKQFVEEIKNIRLTVNQHKNFNLNFVEVNMGGLILDFSVRLYQLRQQEGFEFIHFVVDTPLDVESKRCVKRKRYS